LPQAAAEAKRLGHNSIGTEHILLALFRDQSTIAAKVLGDANITDREVERRILQKTPRGSARDDPPLLTPLTTGTIGNAVGEAERLGHNYVGTEHFLLALFGDSEALAGKVLAQMGATYDDSRRRVIDKLTGITATPREQ
jgi:ATP-dependent Clp protease ATP-binding subunit ClpC